MLLSFKKRRYMLTSWALPSSPLKQILAGKMLHFFFLVCFASTENLQLHESLRLARLFTLKNSKGIEYKGPDEMWARWNHRNSVLIFSSNHTVALWWLHKTYIITSTIHQWMNRWWVQLPLKLVECKYTESFRKRHGRYRKFSKAISSCIAN